MIMKKSAPAESPDAYVAALTGWRKPLVEVLRLNACRREARGADQVGESGLLLQWSRAPYPCRRSTRAVRLLARQAVAGPRRAAEAQRQVRVGQYCLHRE